MPAIVTASVQDGAGCPWRGKGVARPPEVMWPRCIPVGFGCGPSWLRRRRRLPGRARASLPLLLHNVVGPALVPFPHQPYARGCSCCRGRFSLLSLLSTHLQGVAPLGGRFPFRPSLCARLYPPPGKVPPECLLAPPERGSRVRSR